MDRYILMAIMLIVSWLVMFYLGWKFSRRDLITVGNLKVCTGDPDGVYMFLESYVGPEYIMTQKIVTLSVDVTDVSQK